MLPSRSSSCSKYTGLTAIKRFVLKTSKSSWKNLLKIKFVIKQKILLSIIILCMNTIHFYSITCKI